VAISLLQKRIDQFNPVLHESFHDFSVKVHSTGRLSHAVGQGG